MRTASNRISTVVTGVAALAAVTALGACSNSATKEASSPASSPPAATQNQTQAADHNHADMMFARMMIPHHEQAIEMSDIILGKQDIDPRVVELATQIKAAQAPEIQQMQGWLDQWGMGDMPGMGDTPGHGGMPGMGDPSGTMMPDMPGHGGMGMGMGEMGMMSPAEMQALKDAEGTEAAKLFLTGMIKHHEGAINMARDEIKNGKFPAEIELAKSIESSQQKEIDTMKQILASL